VNDPLTLGYIFSGTALGLLLLISAFFYRLGYWRASGVRGPRFDRLAPALRLNQSTWRAEFSSFGQRMDDEAHVVTLTFRQSGSRLAAEGIDESGRRWSLEGVVFQRHITFLTLERSTAGHALGSGHLDADDGRHAQQHLTRCRMRSRPHIATASGVAGIRGFRCRNRRG